jgi:hypothetical protein
MKIKLLIGICLGLAVGILVWRLKPTVNVPHVDQAPEAKVTTDASGKVTERIEFTGGKEVRRKTTYKQDRPDSIQTFDAKGTLRSQDTCSYDANGKLSQVRRVTHDGSVLQMTFTYDENGNESSRRLIDSTGNEVPLEKQKEVWGD